MTNSINDTVRDKLIADVTDELPVLRAKMAITQEDLSQLVGISRQTYSKVESKKKRMNWTVFLALIAVFEYNEGAREILKNYGLTERVKIFLKHERIRSA